MKNCYNLACVLICWLACAANVHAQSPNSPMKSKTVKDVENRQVYAVTMGGPDYGGKHGLCTFQTGSSKSATFMKEFEGLRSIFAGAAAHGDYYGFFYEAQTLSVDPVGLFKVDLSTGKETKLSDWSKVRFKFQDMTFDYSTNTMYASGFETESYLYTVDLTTGVQEQGPTFKTVEMAPLGIWTLAATYDGQLYGLDGNTVLYKIDKETGVSDSILDMRVVLNEKKQLMYSCSMEFDHTDEALYLHTDEINGFGADIETVYTRQFYKIDVNKKTVKKMGSIGSGSQMKGLYIPFVIAGFDAPGKITNFKVIPGSDAKEEATITWKNPEVTHGGDVLKGDLTFVVERDGNIIGSLLGMPGEEMSWFDGDVKEGEHIYIVKVSNEVGEGERNVINTYVGRDKPDFIKDLAINVGDECKSIKLNWTIPEKGEHGGLYDKSQVRFKIVRYPDNKVIQESYEGSSYEDKTTNRMLAYYYGITPFNAVGSGAETVAKTVVIAGKPLDLPYALEVEDSKLTKNQWTVYDAGQDYWSWAINSGYSANIFGDLAFAIDYIVLDPSSTLDADEWLISPPLNFEAGKDYILTFDTRSAGVDELHVTFGKLNSPESQTQFIKHSLFTEEYDGWGFQQHQYQLPRVEGVHCVGFNLVTAIGRSQMLQINNINVLEGLVGIESTVAGENAKVILNSNMLTIEGNFMTAEVYNITGICVASINRDNAQVTTAGWQPGIYIVKVAGADAVYTQKIMVK